MGQQGSVQARIQMYTYGTVGTYGTWRTSLYLTSMCLDSPDSPETRPETVADLGIVRFGTGSKSLR